MPVAEVVQAQPPFTTDEHWQFLAEFIHYEKQLGGPDPHIATMGVLMAETDSWEEKVWRAGCYAAGYNVPTAEAIWQQWPWPRVLAEQGEFAFWIRTHWAGIGLRRERRAVRTPTKFTKCLLSYAHWMQGLAEWWGTSDFEYAWQRLDEIYGMGRYVLLKLNEVLCRYAGGNCWQTDIRARGGASPRAGLALLWPEHALWLAAEHLAAAREAEVLAVETKRRLANYGVHPSWFELQVVLCEYKKCWQGRQYPGRTHDTELRYLRASQRYWGNESRILDARSATFKPHILGELQGWSGARDELSEVLPRYRYTWSDEIYSYWGTRDLAMPVKR